MNFDLHESEPADYEVLKNLLEEKFEDVVDLKEGSTFKLNTEIKTPKEVLRKIMWAMLRENLEWDADLIVTRIEEGAEQNTQVFRAQIDAGIVKKES